MDTNDRMHQCTYCDKRFRKLEHLTRHTRTHTKEKPYLCHCGSSFARRDLLKRHTRLSHNPSEDGQVENEAQTQHDAVESPDRILPIPPEYAGIDSPFLSPQQGADILSEFNSFFRGSGLRKLANERLEPAHRRNSYNDVDLIQPSLQSNLRRLSRSSANAGRVDTDTKVDTAAISPRPVFDHLESMDSMYEKFRATFIEQGEKLNAASDREQKLLDRIMELERMLALSEEKSVVETRKACAAAREASEWRTQHEALRGTLQNALGQQT